MALSCKISWSVIASYSGVRGRVTGAGSLSETGAIALSDGTAAGQADGLFTVADTLQAGATATYPLANGLIDLYGAVLDFSALKVILIGADPANTADLVVGGGTWPGFFGDASNTIAVKPGCSLLMSCSDANGWPVVDGSDGLQISCAAAAAYDLVLIGVSSNISPPAWATPPAIVGTPMVGAATSCTDGNYSGAPALQYQWYIGGSPIAGARGQGAQYTPVAGDVGRKLSRTTLGLNIAGGTRISTAGVVVQAAAAPAAGAADMTQAGNPVQTAL